LLIYESAVPADNRPRLALESIRDFAETGKRTNKLRKAAMDAYRASLEAKDLAASAAARSAGLAAASAFTHPFKDVSQAEHILGPAAYAALALELNNKGDQKTGDNEVAWAIENVDNETAALLDKMPARDTGNKRIEQLLFHLDSGIRDKYKIQV